MDLFKPCKTVVLDRSWKWIVLPNKRGTNLETQLLEVWHMSRPTFFYLGLPNSIPKPTFTNVCGLPFIAIVNLMAGFLLMILYVLVMFELKHFPALSIQLTQYRMA